MTDSPAQTMKALFARLSLPYPEILVPAAIFVVAVLAAPIVRLVFDRVLGRWAQKTRFKIDDLLLAIFRRPVGQTVVLGGALLALEAIHEVGPGGDFITAPHTTEHFRNVWYPRLLDRRPYESWVADGKTTAATRARELARDTIRSHQPDRLPEEMVAELEAIADAADAAAD